MTNQKFSVIDGHKLCSRCDQRLPVASFTIDNSAPSGLNRACTPCRKEIRNSRQEHRYSYKRLYGVGTDFYDNLLSIQGGVCAICFSPPGADALAIDHCHTTGAVRGLLCRSCNAGLGRYNDDPARLRRAADYLENAASNPSSR